MNYFNESVSNSKDIILPNYQTQVEFSKSPSSIIINLVKIFSIRTKQKSTFLKPVSKKKSLLL